MSEEIQKLFDAIAPKYDLINTVLSCHIDSLWRKEAIDCLNDTVCEKALDLCAGTLALSKSLLEKKPKTNITAVDFAKVMLDEGQKSLTPEQASQITTIVGDAQKIVFPDHEFDVALCAYGLRNIEDNPLVLKKLFKTLKPGGKLIILDFFKPEGLLSNLFNKTYGEFIIPLLGKVVSKHPMAYDHLRDSIRKFYTARDYQSLLKDLGFKNINAKAQTGGISHLITAEVES